MNTKVEVMAGRDELGELEEFTWDLFPAVDSQKSAHLNTDGLPKAGTFIVPGMIVVGKIGKTRDYDAAHQPTALEIHGLSFEEIHSRYGSMWKDSSLYADSQTTGIVKEAYLDDLGGQKRAIVVIEKNTSPVPIVSAKTCAAMPTDSSIG